MSLDRVLAAVVLPGRQWRINGFQDIGGWFAVGADNDPVGMKEIRYRGAFAQEFRIGGHIEVCAGSPVALHDAPDPLVRIDRDRALLDNHLVTADGTCDLRRHRIHIGEVCIPRVGLWRTHGDENGLRMLRGRGQIRGEFQTLVPVPRQKLG
jgi:hypothetical protein